MILVSSLSPILFSLPPPFLCYKVSYCSGKQFSCLSLWSVEFMGVSHHIRLFHFILYYLAFSQKSSLTVTV